MLLLIVLGGVLAIFLAAMLASRYASWSGIVVPVAIVYALGEAWEWDSEASFFVFVAGLVGGLGFITGIFRRRGRRRRVREGLV